MRSCYRGNALSSPNGDDNGCHLTHPGLSRAAWGAGSPSLVNGRYHRVMAMTSPDTGIERAGLGPARVTDLTTALGLAQSTVSKHLACLRDCGLVTSAPAGRASVFRLAQPALADMLAAAEAVLAATGNAVALCPVWGTECCDQDRP